MTNVPGLTIVQRTDVDRQAPLSPATEDRLQRARRIDALGVDRSRYRGHVGDRELAKLKVDEVAVSVEDRLSRRRDADQESRLSVLRKLLAKADKEFPIREPLAIRPEGRR